MLLNLKKYPEKFQLKTMHCHFLWEKAIERKCQSPPKMELIEKSDKTLLWPHNGTAAQEENNFHTFE